MTVPCIRHLSVRKKIAKTFLSLLSRKETPSSQTKQGPNKIKSLLNVLLISLNFISHCFGRMRPCILGFICIIIPIAYCSFFSRGFLSSLFIVHLLDSIYIVMSNVLQHRARSDLDGNLGTSKNKPKQKEL